MTSIEYATSNSFFNKSLIPDGIIHWSEAKDHIGEYASIYGEVTGTYFDWKEYERWVGTGVEPPPTFIEIGAKYPNEELLKVVIWGRNWSRFRQPPDAMYKDAVIVFKGRLYLYKSLVHVQIDSPDDIRIIEPIPNLYADGYYLPSDSDDFEPVFSTSSKPNPAEDDDFKDYEDLFDEWCQRDTPEVEPSYYEGIEYYNGNSGGKLFKIGEYYYDDDGNTVDDSCVRERSWDDEGSWTDRWV